MQEPKQITVDATIDNVQNVTDFVNEELENLGCSMKAQMQIDIAIDELFGNIAHYAYGSNSGTATVEVHGRKEEPAQVFITFKDQGVPYNPLEKADPDVTLSVEDRQIGGLGIFLVKKTMDEMQYQRCKGQNVLTIKKRIMA